ncbi:hypothetical protein BOX15_Mlig016909g3, partial [Macrostomum lignano]
ALVRCFGFCSPKLFAFSAQFFSLLQARTCCCCCRRRAATMAQLYLLLPCLLLAAWPFPVASGQPCRRVEQLLGRLSDLIDFYASDAERVNTDGYFGLRLSRDLLAPTAVAAAVLTQCGSSPANQLQSALLRQDLLASRFESRIADRAAGYDRDTYFRICEPMAGRFQRLTGAPRSAMVLGDPGGAAGRWPNGEAAVASTVYRLIEYDEPAGDACLMKALRTDGGCWNTATCPYFDRNLEKSSGYYLTHQLLYKLIKDLGPCESVSPDRGLATEFTAVCRKVLSEFKLIQAANWTLISRQMGDGMAGGLRDLHMEQALLCGLAGFKDFYNGGSVSTVASWQDPQLGCFKLSVSGSAAAASGPAVGRKILRDAEMQGGCSAHSTGMAMGYYSNAIRFLLDV